MELKGKKLLILGGIKLACDIVIRAKKMGVYVVVADYNTDSPAKKIADEAVLINAMDVDAIVEYCIKNKIDGVTTGFIDILLEPCLKVCNRLNLHCYLTPEMIEISTNKIKFKDTCNKYGVSVPQTYLVGNIISEEIYEKINYPVFVKPLDSSGSRGAGVCYNREELDKQFNIAIGYSGSHNAIIEDYIVGREFLMNYIAQDGEFRMISMFDRYSSSDRSAAINYANLSKGPSRAIDYYYNEIDEKVIGMFKSLGFKDGIYFIQGYSNGNRITFFEMGCRLGGSYYDLEKKCVGIDPIDMLIRYALTGKMTEEIYSIPYNIGKYNNIAVCINYLLKGGDETIFSIEGIDEIKKMSSLVEYEQRQFVGEHYQIDKIIDKPALCVYLAVDNMEQLINDVNYMNSIFHVKNEKGESLLKEKFNPQLLKTLE